MKEEITIDQCFHACPFFGTSNNEMGCWHPYWNDKGVYENMIITQENSRNGNIPELCPLRSGELNRTYKLG